MKHHVHVTAAGLTLVFASGAVAQQAPQQPTTPLLPPAAGAQAAPPAGSSRQAPLAQPGETRAQTGTAGQTGTTGQQASEPQTGTAGTQSTPAGGQVGMVRRQVAQQCINDLQAFGQRADQDGFWLTGYGTGRIGWGYGAVDRTAATTGTLPVDQRPAPGTTRTAVPTQRIGQLPWGANMRGIESPRYQVRVLYEAANVLAHRGDEQACQAALGELRNVYDSHIARLRQAGVEPGQVISWRQERIAAAQPVTQMNMGVVSIDDITGTEVRNIQDRRLGTINAVVMDPRSATITHVILAHGGFLGIGREHIAVPWKDLRATPGLNTFVLNVPEQVVENAPKVDPDTFGNPSTFSDERQRIDRYWQQHTAG